MVSVEISVLDRLVKHLDRTASSISDSIREASEKHSGTPESVANARELSIRKTLERFFPYPYKITKGAIYDSFGQRSASIDCVICSPNHPALNDEYGNIEIILVDGVYCAIEVKPDLTDLPDNFGVSRKQEPEIIRALKQMQSVKRLLRAKEPESDIFGKNTPEKKDYSKRCPSYIFSNDSANIEVLAKYISDYYLLNEIPVEEQFDVLLVLKKGLLINNKCSDFSLTNSVVNGQWISHISVYPVDIAFRLFIQRLVSEIGPEMTMSTPVLKRYLDRLPFPHAILGFRNTK